MRRGEFFLRSWWPLSWSGYSPTTCKAKSHWHVHKSPPCISCKIRRSIQQTWLAVLDVLTVQQSVCVTWNATPYHWATVWDEYSWRKRLNTQYIGRLRGGLHVVGIRDQRFGGTVCLSQSPGYKGTCNSFWCHSAMFSRKRLYSLF